MDTGGGMQFHISHSGIIYNQNGMIMLIALLFLLLLTILGTSSLYLAYTETSVTRIIESDAKALYTTESGIEQTLYWFSNPDKFDGTPQDTFTKKMQSGTSFFDEDGNSQYTGTQEIPDMVYPTSDNEIKVYGPTVPGALCTVISTGVSGRITSTVTAELYEDIAGIKILPGYWR